MQEWGILNKLFPSQLLMSMFFYPSNRWSSLALRPLSDVSYRLWLKKVGIRIFWRDLPKILPPYSAAPWVRSGHELLSWVQTGRSKSSKNHRILLAPWPVVWWFQRQMESCLQQNDATHVQNSERGACSRPCDCRTCPCCSPGEGAGLGLVWQYAIQVPPWFLCTKQPWSEPKGSCPSFWSFSFGPGNRGQNESAPPLIRVQLPHLRGSFTVLKASK